MKGGLINIEGFDIGVIVVVGILFLLLYVFVYFIIFKKAERNESDKEQGSIGVINNKYKLLTLGKGKKYNYLVLRNFSKLNHAFVYKNVKLLVKENFEIDFDLILICKAGIYVIKEKNIKNLGVKQNLKNKINKKNYDYKKELTENKRNTKMLKKAVNLEDYCFFSILIDNSVKRETYKNRDAFTLEEFIKIVNEKLENPFYNDDQIDFINYKMIRTNSIVLS